MISWIVIMLLFWHHQKLTQPGDENIVRYFDPLPSRYFHLPQIINCISYLLDKIFHYIKIISIISWKVKMLLFWHYQNLSELNPGVKIFWPPSKIDDKVLFAFYI